MKKEVIKVPIDVYLLWMLKGKPLKIPSIKFWCLTILIIRQGIKIEMKDGHILTIKDCFKEIEDLFMEKENKKKT